MLEIVYKATTPERFLHESFPAPLLISSIISYENFGA